MAKAAKIVNKSVNEMSATKKKEYQAAFQKVFMSAPQRNPNNSGKNYVRPYKKTKVTK